MEEVKFLNELEEPIEETPALRAFAEAYVAVWREQSDDGLPCSFHIIDSLGIILEFPDVIARRAARASSTPTAPNIRPE
jgi:hypothetical protein